MAENFRKNQEYKKYDKKNMGQEDSCKQKTIRTKIYLLLLFSKEGRYVYLFF